MTPGVLKALQDAEAQTIQPNARAIDLLMALSLQADSIFLGMEGRSEMLQAFTRTDDSSPMAQLSAADVLSDAQALANESKQAWVTTGHTFVAMVYAETAGTDQIGARSLFADLNGQLMRAGFTRDGVAAPEETQRAQEALSMAAAAANPDNATGLDLFNALVAQPRSVSSAIFQAEHLAYMFEDTRKAMYAALPVTRVKANAKALALSLGHAAATTGHLLLALDLGSSKLEALSGGLLLNQLRWQAEGYGVLADAISTGARQNVTAGQPTETQDSSGEDESPALTSTAVRREAILQLSNIVDALLDLEGDSDEVSAAKEFVVPVLAVAIGALDMQSGSIRALSEAVGAIRACHGILVEAQKSFEARAQGPWTPIITGFIEKAIFELVKIAMTGP